RVARKDPEKCEGAGPSALRRSGSQHEPGRDEGAVGFRRPDPVVIRSLHEGEERERNATRHGAVLEEEVSHLGRAVVRFHDIRLELSPEARAPANGDTLQRVFAGYLQIDRQRLVELYGVVHDIPRTGLARLISGERRIFFELHLYLTQLMCRNSGSFRRHRPPGSNPLHRNAVSVWSAQTQVVSSQGTCDYFCPRRFLVLSGGRERWGRGQK